MDPEALAAARQTYTRDGLVEDDLAADPFAMFARWYDDASMSGLVEPNAMVVATVDPDGAPSSRFVLLKGITAADADGPADDTGGAGRGFVFYTNLGSRKGAALAQEPRIALLFPWHPLERQVRVEGTASLVDRAEVAAYFASRPRGSQLGAWASRQSSVVDGREELDRSYADVERRFAGGEVPVPDFWGGYRVVPESVEFWQGRPGRMHDRLVYRRSPGGWRTERLAP